MPANSVLTVTELTARVRGLLESGLGMVWVEGEISNYRRQASGHHYFTLKDAGAQLSCVLFRGNASRLRGLQLAEGQQVQVSGDVSVYAARGQYQLVVKLVQLRGQGDLQAKFEALKQRLNTEGLFDGALKQRLPAFPQRLGIVTSPTGAALRDMLNVLDRRAPWVEVVVSPVRVQGGGSAEEIAAAIAEFNEISGKTIPALDLIIATRGGGSIEDLWAFNEEVVARAIHASHLPVVSAVGHEIDFTISDFCADLRAPTPSAAAEIVVPSRVDLEARLRGALVTLKNLSGSRLEHLKTTLRVFSEGVLFREPTQRLNDARQRLDLAALDLDRGAEVLLDDYRRRVEQLDSELMQHRPDQQIGRQRERLEYLSTRLQDQCSQGVEVARQQVAELKGMLRVLGPTATLDRGYSVTTDAAGGVVRSAKNVKPSERIRTRLAEGVIDSTVEAVR